MLQLTHTLKNGAMRLTEVPVPAVDRGAVLVRAHYSAVSAGTEGRTVRDARLNPLAKAWARQKEVRQVLDSVRTHGLTTTYQLVTNRLEALSALGYSVAGEVIGVGAEVSEFKIGDRVACGGASAVHAEVVAVPRRLCVPVPAGVDLRDAALTAIAATALQGVRQSELGLGGSCAVVGLGLIGLLTVQLLKAAGVRVAGIDVAPSAVQFAAAAGADLALLRSEAGLEAAVAEFTRGHGVDAVIITASSTSTDPVDLAGVLCRHKGKVVVVGGVPTGFARPNYYRKELDLRMSCSYGPGRYDRGYEDHGVDYPIGYVRWTEQRNMTAFVDLLAAGKVDVRQLISHEFPFERAADAYDLMVRRQDPFAGLVLRYDTTRALAPVVALRPPDAAPARGAGNLAVIGAGAFAQNVLLPALQGQGQLIAVATTRGNTSRHVAGRFGFEYCTSDTARILADDRIDTVFVATRHASHAAHVLAALRAGKHVFVEKPLCMTAGELDEIGDAHRASGRQLMVGFNRRFAPMVAKLCASLPAHVPRAIQYRVNAGPLPADHWVHDPAIGGGRILGEACHFLDLAAHLAGAPITTVTAHALAGAAAMRDTAAIALTFDNGSTATIAYFSNGHTALRKEHLEVFAAGRVGVVDDFQRLSLYGERVEEMRSRRQDKGHAEQFRRFLHAVRTGGSAPIPFREIDNTMRATFAALESMRTGRTVAV